MDKKEPQDVQLNLAIQAKEEIARGVYANLVGGSASVHDVTLDFVYLEPQAASSNHDDVPKTGYLVSRVILAHSHIEPLIVLLQRQQEAIVAAADAGE